MTTDTAEKKIISSIRDTTSKIKEVRTFPKEKNMVLGYLDKKVIAAPISRFSPRSVPWHHYYPELKMKTTTIGGTPKPQSSKVAVISPR